LLACLFLLSPISSQGATNFSRGCLVKSRKSGMKPKRAPNPGRLVDASSSMSSHTPPP
jgi:hypothetical protein